VGEGEPVNHDRPQDDLNKIQMENFHTISAGRCRHPTLTAMQRQNRGQVLVHLPLFSGRRIFVSLVKDPIKVYRN